MDLSDDPAAAATSMLTSPPHDVHREYRHPISLSTYLHLNCSGHAAAYVFPAPSNRGAGSLCDIHLYDFCIQSQFSRGRLFDFPAMG
jgi:hypothetical protein